MKPMPKPMPVDIKKIYADAGSNIFDSDSGMPIPKKMLSASHPWFCQLSAKDLTRQSSLTLDIAAYDQ